MSLRHFFAMWPMGPHNTSSAHRLQVPMTLQHVTVILRLPGRPSWTSSFQMTLGPLLSFHSEREVWQLVQHRPCPTSCSSLCSHMVQNSGWAALWKTFWPKMCYWLLSSALLDNLWFRLVFLLTLLLG